MIKSETRLRHIINVVKVNNPNDIILLGIPHTSLGFDKIMCKYGDYNV
jgi:hypothetical protein